MTDTVKSVALYYREGSSDKEYHASIEPRGGGYVVNFAYGRRGSSLITGTKTSSPVPLAKAEQIYDKLVSEKTGKGYVPNGDAKPFSAPETAERVTGLLPMLLNPITEGEAEGYINDDKWLMEEKLDGKRIMARVAGGVVTASNRKGLAVGIPREIEAELAQLGDCVVDGELCGSKYVLFDIIETGGQPINMSCYSRLKTLRDIFDTFPPKHLELVKYALTTAEKRALYDSLKTKEGVVFKHVDGQYKAGRPNSGGNQLKCKFWSSATCMVSSVNAKRSVALQLQGPGGMVAVGNVTVPPNYDLPGAGDLVEVKYLYAYRGGALYQPQYLGTRDDIGTPDLVSGLKFKSDDTDEDEPATTSLAGCIEPEFAD